MHYGESSAVVWSHKKVYKAYLSCLEGRIVIWPCETTKKQIYEGGRWPVSLWLCDQLSLKVHCFVPYLVYFKDDLAVYLNIFVTFRLQPLQ